MSAVTSATVNRMAADPAPAASDPAVAAASGNAVLCGQCHRAYQSPTDQPEAVIECPRCGAQARRDSLVSRAAITIPAALPRAARSRAGWWWIGALALAVVVLGGVGAALWWLQPASIRPWRSATSTPAAPAAWAEEAETLAEAALTATRILASPDLDSARPRLLDAAQLTSLMDRYHARHPWQPITLTGEPLGSVIKNNDRRLARLVMQTSHNTYLTLLLEETINGWKLDWEDLVKARHFAWEDFHQNPPTEPVMLRVMARQGSATEAHFKGTGLTPETAVVVRLDGPQPGIPALAVVDKTSDLGLFLQRDLTWEQGRPYRCDLRMADPSLTPPRVDITRFVGEGWNMKNERGLVRRQPTPTIP
jgi:hypothetical protein